ncbi:MAG: hypothetical protein AVDCRST_MAG89-5411, partial [uncultured Gemmatimonadetes bacterium]
ERNPDLRQLQRPVHRQRLPVRVPLRALRRSVALGVRPVRGGNGGWTAGGGGGIVRRHLRQRAQRAFARAERGLVQGARYGAARGGGQRARALSPLPAVRQPQLRQLLERGRGHLHRVRAAAGPRAGRHRPRSQDRPRPRGGVRTGDGQRSGPGAARGQLPGLRRAGRAGQVLPRVRGSAVAGQDVRRLLGRDAVQRQVLPRMRRKGL